MRGIRIDLAGRDVTDRVYVGEPFLKRLIGAMDEISEGMGSFLSRSTVSSRCFGSAAFLSAFREGAHCFHASQCSMADGWFGLSVSTGVATFRFTDLTPSPNFELTAQACGAYATRVEEPGEIADALAKALKVVKEERRQALLNVVCKNPLA